MKVTEYIRDKWISIGIMILTCLAAAVFMNFLEIEGQVIVAVETIFLSGSLVILLLEGMTKKPYYDELTAAWDELEEKSYLTELIKRPGFYEGRLLYDILKENEKYLNDVIASREQEIGEYKEYVETWVHEIKTPIAVQELLIDNNRNPVTSSLEEETKKIEAYVEQMLYYTKSSSLASDYMIQTVNLKQLVMEVIKKNKKMMVGAGAMPKLFKLDYEILIDPKWMEFILGQVVTNAVKYGDMSRDLQISFRAQEERDMILLSVADNGVGISEGDIKRVFQKGFTGENGRRFKKSTGMGLYLCRKLCEKMEVPIAIQSRQGEGTELKLWFKKADMG